MMVRLEETEEGSETTYEAPWYRICTRDILVEKMWGVGKEKHSVSYFQLVPTTSSTKLFVLDYSNFENLKCLLFIFFSFLFVSFNCTLTAVRFHLCIISRANVLFFC
jgi:hypothetical protein